MNSQNHLLLLCGLLAVPKDVTSFSIPSTQRSPAFRVQKNPRVTAKATSPLHAFASTSNYLDTLTAVVETPRNFGTGDYLNSLSQIADTSTGLDSHSSSVNPEEFLTNLSTQLAEAASATGFYGELVDVGSSTIQLAEATSATGTNFESGGFYGELVDVGASTIQLVEATSAAGELVDASSITSATSAAEGLADPLASIQLAEATSAAGELVDSSTITSTSGAEGLADSLMVSALALDSPVDEEVARNSLQIAASDMSDSLSSQLSDLSYGSLVDEKTTKASSSFAESLTSKFSGTDAQEQATSKFSEFAASSGASMNEAFSSVKNAGAAQISKLFGQVSSSLEEIPNKVSEAGTASVKVVSKAVELGSAEVANTGATSAQAVGGALQAQKMTIVAGTSSTVKTVGDQSLSDVANGVVEGIKFMGGLLVKLLDLILDKLGGTNVAQLVHSAQTSVSTVIDGATQSAITTINDIGNMTIAQAVQNLVALIIAVSNLLLTVLNAVIKLLSGKEASEWALAATSALNHQANQLTAQASAISYDLTHKSLGELSSSIGDFSQQVGNELVSNIGSLNDVISSGSQAVDGVSSIAGSTLDSVTSVVQMAQLM